MKNKKFVVLAILVLAAILRLVSLNQSFWLDEAINVLAARDRGLINLINEYTVGDFHPPLYHLLLWSWLGVLPATEVIARLPSVLMGVATVFVTFKIAKILTKEMQDGLKISKLAAILLATSSLHIYYSQEARMYALAALTTSISIFALLKLRDKQSMKNKLIFLISLTIMLLSDYQPWLLLPLFFLSFPGLTSLSLLFTLPWWPTLFRQIETGLGAAKAFPAWEAVVGKLTAKAALLVPVKFLVGRTSIDNNLLFAIVLTVPLLITAAAFLKLIKVKEWKIGVIKRWLLIPLILGAIIAIKIPIFSYFRFLFILPAFFLLVAVGIYRLSPRWRKPAIIILLFTNLISSTAYLGMERFHREDWRTATAYLHEYQTHEALVVFPNLAQAAAFDYYNAGKLKMQDRETLNLTGGKSHVFFVRYVSDIFDPEERVAQALKENGYKKVRERVFNGILIWQYQKG